MTVWGWTVAALLALSLIGKILYLATGDYPRKTTKEAEALDVVINFGLVNWWLILIFTQ